MNKKKTDLLKKAGRFEIKGNKNVTVEGLATDSRKVTEGCAFVAIRGSQTDGHLFIDNAIEAGASVIVAEFWPESVLPGITYVRCNDSRIALAYMASSFYDEPSKKIVVIGVTGTNGKTTVATMLFDLFKELGHKVGLISTIEIRIGEERRPSMLTTPDPLMLHATLKSMKEAGCRYAFMEVSSHAVDQKRVAGIDFDVGVFTNITRDHLDYHGDFKSYIAAKKGFFDDLGEGATALVNLDDRNGRVMLQNCNAKHKTYSIRKWADYKARIIGMDDSGLYLDINGHKMMSRLIGLFNAYNLVAIYAVADLLDVASEERLLEVLSGLGSVRGRFEIISEKPMVIVDYAHTPDALSNVLDALRKLVRSRKIVTVVGCGGDRDKGKRPEMGQIAVRQSDVAIFTSDNPRNEDPLEIIAGMKVGLDRDELQQVLEIPDRRSAIFAAISTAGNEGVVLVAGKGHEDYQEIKGHRIFFSDAATVKDILSKNI